jgi:signal peptidase I
MPEDSRTTPERAAPPAGSRVVQGWASWRGAGRGVLDFAKTLVIAFVLAQLVMVSVAQAFQVEQYSMEPTLLPHDRVLVNKFIYRLREPQRGDVIVLHYPRDPSRNYIKRIVALPGDRVEIRNGHLYINNNSIEELYINGQPSGDYGPEVVPEGSYFVLGDNRNNSEDSRAFGFLKREQVVGRAILIYWPPQRARILHTP